MKTTMPNKSPLLDRHQLHNLTSTTILRAGGRARRSANMKSNTCALIAIGLNSCMLSSPPDPSKLEYISGDVYETKKPLLVESPPPGFPYIQSRERYVAPASERDGQPESYLKNPRQWPNIHGVIPSGTRVTISKVQEHHSGLNGRDWEAFGRFSREPWADLEMSLYLISGDDERERYSNGSVNRRLLRLVKHKDGSAEQIMDVNLPLAPKRHTKSPQ